MYKELKRMCIATVLLIKPFVLSWFAKAAYSPVCTLYLYLCCSGLLSLLSLLCS